MLLENSVKKNLLQLDEDVDFVMQAMREESSFGVGQEREVIWLLWHQRLHLLRQQTQFEVITSRLNLQSANDMDPSDKLLVCRVCILLFKFSELFCKNSINNVGVLNSKYVSKRLEQKRDSRNTFAKIWKEAYCKHHYKITYDFAFDRIFQSSSSSRPNKICSFCF